MKKLSNKLNPSNWSPKVKRILVIVILAYLTLFCLGIVTLVLVKGTLHPGLWIRILAVFTSIVILFLFWMLLAEKYGSKKALIASVLGVVGIAVWMDLVTSIIKNLGKPSSVSSGSKVLYGLILIIICILYGRLVLNKRVS